MNIKTRLAKLETALKQPEQKLDWWDEAERRRTECKHPPSSFHLRREYPSLWRPSTPEEMVPPYHKSLERLSPASKHKLIVAGHCDLCGYDEKLLECKDLSAEQWDRLCKLKAGNDDYGTPDHHAWDRYARELIDNGHLDFVPWPPSPEIEDMVRSCGGSNPEFILEGLRGLRK